ncbi:hypothetical protein LPB072_10125 [Hydrogenophaga crassostreae]|uniref:Uncharacterized protein n=1 Tax=Hydrogenophaga crassostreae TaxID=1763535 RepID=A0A1D8NVN0_9BURK|nr:hypothetical protein LPB072_10125 [Hydrogenophaga crassostreae]
MPLALSATEKGSPTEQACHGFGLRPSLGNGLTQSFPARSWVGQALQLTRQWRVCKRAAWSTRHFF